MDIRVDRKPTLSIRTEISMLNAALAQRPAASAVRDKLSALLIKTDDFDAAIALLSDARHGSLDWDARRRLINALLARRAEADLVRAHDQAALLASTAPDDAARAIALTEQARALRLLGNEMAAITLLERALASHHDCVSAFKLLTGLWLRGGEADRALALTDVLMAQGVQHTQLLAVRTLALAASGAIDEARALVSEPGFYHAARLDTPAGWDDADAFHAAITQELMSNPDLRYERHGTASVQSWRVDHPALGKTPAVDALLAAILPVAAQHAERCEDGTAHPWLSLKPRCATLRCWCVITEAAGHERWHMHPEGWLSGGYYVAVPETEGASAVEAGCLAFGLPAGQIGDVAARAFGQTLVRPFAGLLNLFPSHAYHRTFAHEGQGRRLCIAFDIIPH
jgi:tetratricopeptide (TPR) repeat protein